MHFSSSTGRLPVAGGQNNPEILLNVKNLVWSLMIHGPGLGVRGLRKLRSITSMICAVVGEGLGLAARSLGSGPVSPPSSGLIPHLEISDSGWH